MNKIARDRKNFTYILHRFPSQQVHLYVVSFGRIVNIFRCRQVIDFIALSSTRSRLMDNMVTMKEFVYHEKIETFGFQYSGSMKSGMGSTKIGTPSKASPYRKGEHPALILSFMSDFFFFFKCEILALIKTLQRFG